MLETLVVIGVCIILIITWVILTYNKLIKLRNKVKDQWSQVDIQLKKRFDMIPNIVEIVKGYAKHEKDTLKTVIEARNSAISAQTPSAEIDANDRLTKALNNLFAISEAYPDLKADENFKSLQKTLEEVESKIAFARQFYNDSVLKYKNAIEVFPTVLVANILGFKQEQFFEIKDEEKENINIKL